MLVRVPAERLTSRSEQLACFQRLDPDAHVDRERVALAMSVYCVKASVEEPADSFPTLIVRSRDPGRPRRGGDE